MLAADHIDHLIKNQHPWKAESVRKDWQINLLFVDKYMRKISEYLEALFLKERIKGFCSIFLSHLAWKTRPKAPSPISLTYWILFLGYSSANSFEFSRSGTRWYMGLGCSRSSRSSDGRAFNVGVSISLLLDRKSEGVKTQKDPWNRKTFLFFFYLLRFLICFTRLRQLRMTMVRKTAAASAVKTITMTDME